MRPLNLIRLGARWERNESCPSYVTGVPVLGNKSLEISRRKLIQMGAVGGAVILALQPEAAHAASDLDATAPLPSSAERVIGRGLTDLAGIHAEYREAVSAFPLALLDGVKFPAESSLTNDAPTEAANGSTVLWQRGSGIAEVFLYWQTATAAAAWQASSVGDTVAATRLLYTLEAGYDSDYRRAVIEDRTNVFISEQVNPARRGNFESIRIGLGF